jgi:uncharacterized protein YbcI
MFTQGEAENAVCNTVNKFMQQYMGKGPTKIKTLIVGDTVVVRISGMLTETEQILANTPNGAELLKSVRRHLMVDAGTEHFSRVFAELLETPVLNIYYDCNLLTNEEFLLATLLEEPTFRQKKT